MVTKHHALSVQLQVPCPVVLLLPCSSMRLTTPAIHCWCPLKCALHDSPCWHETPTGYTFYDLYTVPTVLQDTKHALALAEAKYRTLEGAHTESRTEIGQLQVLLRDAQKESIEAKARVSQLEGEAKAQAAKLDAAVAQAGQHKASLQVSRGTSICICGVDLLAGRSCRNLCARTYHVNLPAHVHSMELNQKNMFF
jgi:hypothetical protein